MVGPPLVCGGCRGEAGPYPVGMSVAERLREARLAAGLTQAQLAQRVGSEQLEVLLFCLQSRQ